MTTYRENGGSRPCPNGDYPDLFPTSCDALHVTIDKTDDVFRPEEVYGKIINFRDSKYQIILPPKGASFTSKDDYYQILFR